MGLSLIVAEASTLDDTGYSALAAELGAGTPDGTAVPVTQVEADQDGGPDFVYAPNPGNAEFSGKTIIDVSALSSPGVYSNHATGVGKIFYGNLGMASGVTDIAGYLADDWLFGGFLQYAPGGPPDPQPSSSSSRVANHSYVGNTGDGAINAGILQRIDWLIERDEFSQVAGFTGANPLVASAFNAVTVNATVSQVTGGSGGANGAYTAGRNRPHLVAPSTSASNATPLAGAALAVLAEAAHANPGWSTDPVVTSVVNRNGDTVYNAERAAVLKAALMAGADRRTHNTDPVANGEIVDYRSNPADQTANGLDRRYGAGQVNVYNSYRLLAAAEQNSDEDDGAGSGHAGDAGFDYDPSFGGSAASNVTATYYFAARAWPATLHASLVWNLHIDGGTAGNFNGTETFHDLNLTLYDVSDPGNWLLVVTSAGSIENSENIWQQIDPAKDYALRVSRMGNFEHDFALAWRVAVHGDITGDGNVDVADLLLMQRGVVGTAALNTVEFLRADIHPAGGDGIVDASDLFALQALLLTP